MSYLSEVTIIIQAGTKTLESVNNILQKEINHVQTEVAVKLETEFADTAEEKWAMFLAEVAVKPETELAWREISSGLDHDFGSVELDKEKKRITIEFADVKWYEDREDVDSYMALFHSVKPYEDYIDAVYIRLGEEMEDIEEEVYGDGFQLAGVERSIEIFNQ